MPKARLTYDDIEEIEEAKETRKLSEIGALGSEEADSILDDFHPLDNILEAKEEGTVPSFLLTRAQPRSQA